jgi:hypothetical protein
MTMKFVKEIETLISMDWQTIAVLAVLCALASYFIRDYLASPPMIVFVFPVLVFFSYLVQQAFIALEAYPPKKLDSWLMWTIMAAILGNIVGTAFVACLGRVRDFFGSSRPA